MAEEGRSRRRRSRRSGNDQAKGEASALLKSTGVEVPDAPEQAERDEERLRELAVAEDQLVAEFNAMDPGNPEWTLERALELMDRAEEQQRQVFAAGGTVDGIDFDHQRQEIRTLWAGAQRRAKAKGLVGKAPTEKSSGGGRGSRRERSGRAAALADKMRAAFSGGGGGDEPTEPTAGRAGRRRRRTR